MKFNPILLILAFLVIDAQSTKACESDLENPGGRSTAFESIRHSLETFGVSGNTMVVDANTTLEEAQVVVIGMPHPVSEGVVLSPRMETMARLGEKTTNTIVQKLSKPKDVVLLEGIYYEEKELSPNDPRYEGEIVPKALESLNLRYKGWDHFSLQMYIDEVTHFNQVGNIANRDAAQIIEYILYQRTGYMALSILKEAPKLKRKQKIFVLCGSLHADGLEGILQPKLRESGLKYAILTSSNRQERMNKSSRFFNGGLRDEAALSHLLMDQLNSAWSRRLERALGFDQKFQGDFTPFPLNLRN